MRILFVGPLSGYTSYPVVCKGLLQALTSAGFDVDVADTTWDGSPDHTAPILMEEERSIRFLEHKEVARLVKEGESTEAKGDVCVVVNPTHHLMGIKDKGYRIAGMFVGDVDKIPGPWLAIMEKLDVVLTPSSWGKQVIRSSGVETDVLVCNHGISQVFRIPVRPRLPDRPFVFFHACSAMYFPERKGTPQALEAFSRLVEDGHDVILHLVMGGRTKPMRKMLRETLSKAAIERVRPFWQEGAREPEEIRQAYVSCHAGLYPSRAEGMGMMPIEERACGVPVVQTMCTGHADHLDPSLDPREWGITVVRSGPMVEAWGKFGRAPEVKTDDVYEAMGECMENYDALLSASVAAADGVRAGWAWEETTRPLVGWIRSLPRC